MAKIRYFYEPDYAVPPGNTLLETIESLNISQAELAERSGRPIKTINGIIKGKVSITAETALQLEKVLGVEASFWLNLEGNYQEALARIKEKKALQEHLAWLKTVPVKELVDYEWIPNRKDKVECLSEVLRFFGVASVDAWNNHWANPQVSYRRASCYKSNPGAITAWLRRGEIESQERSCKPFSRSRFVEALNEIKALTKEDPSIFEPQIVKLCEEAGVALVFVKELPKCPISGAARWISPEKAMIQLTLRYRSDDHFWFTFFHEAGHILNPRKREIFIDSDTDSGYDEDEEEANRFARNILIPDSVYRRFLASMPINKEKVLTFADSLNIAPGIVVGRLQHDKKIGYNRLNTLKQKIDWAN